MITLDEDFSILGARVGNDFSAQLDFGQDFSGDGFADIAVSSPNALRADNFDERGTVDIIFGRPDDITGGRAVTITQIQDRGVLHIEGLAVEKKLGGPRFVGDNNGDGNADLAMSGRNGPDFDSFIIFGGTTLEDGTDTALESQARDINVFDGSTFAPLNQPITKWAARPFRMAMTC